jgi:hypothetical protein
VPYPPLFLLIRPSLALARHRHRLQILLSSIRVLIFEHTVHGGPQCAARCMNGLSHSLAKLGYISTLRMTMPHPVSSSMCSKDVGFRLLVLPRYLMQRLTVNETTSRPWAVAYVSHSRILAGPRDEAGPRQRGVWTGFLVWVFFLTLQYLSGQCLDGRGSCGNDTKDACSLVCFCHLNTASTS